MVERNVRVLLASESPRVRDVLRQVVQMENGVEVVAQARDVAGALTLAANLRPDVAVIDSSLPYYVALDTVPLSRINGLDAAQAICREMPTTGVLVLSNLDLINSPDSGFPQNVTAYSIESDGTSFFIGSQDRWLAQRSVPLFAGVVARPQAALQQRDTVSDKFVFFGALTFAGGWFFILTIMLAPIGAALALVGAAAVALGLTVRLAASLWRRIKGGTRDTGQYERSSPSPQLRSRKGNGDRG